MNARTRAARATLAVSLAVLLGACSHARTQSSPKHPASATAGELVGGLTYPGGIVPPKNWTGAMLQGVYPSDDPKQCCFLNGSPILTLDNPRGAQLAVFTFYVPSVKPFLHGRERVNLSLDGVRAGSTQLAVGLQNVSFTIPKPLRAKRQLTARLGMSIAWVPARIGVNADRRELSVMLIRVGYI